MSERAQALWLMARHEANKDDPHGCTWNAAPREYRAPRAREESDPIEAYRETLPKAGTLPL